MSGSICAEEFERALVDAVAAIDGDRPARNRTVGRLMAVREHLHRPTAIEISTIEERTAA